MPNSEFGANAPYNFIPLLDSIRSVENDPPAADQYALDKLSGYFDCTLTTLSPLYIRSTLTDEEYKKKVERTGTKKASDDKPDFFSPGKTLRIPGSSLRGMIRTLVEILSSSAIEAVSSQQMFFRAVADKKNSVLGREYRDRMTTKDANDKEQVISKAGCIVRKGNRYYLYESTPIPELGQSIFRIEKDSLKPLPNSRTEWWREKIWFNPPKTPRGWVQELKLHTEKSIPDGWESGWLIVPGHMDVKGKSIKKFWIITEPDFKSPHKTEIPFESVLAYRDGGGKPQVTFKEKYNNLSNKTPVDFSVLPEIDKSENALPCFFTIEGEEENKQVNFGHTAYFRLAYNHNPKDLVTAKLEEDKLDLTQAIFGVAGGKKGKAGRVFFEDAFLTDLDPSTVLMDEKFPKILSSPKPTSYQHYLEQTEEAKAAMRFGRKEEWGGQLKFWDSKGGAKLRGHKLYWHREAKDWYENEDKSSSSQHTQIQPVKPDVKFNFRVRFENLNDIELGALITALFLPEEGMAHKLGMGKPLGLGSVRIDGDLYLTDPLIRYSSFFSEDGKNWNSGVSRCTNLEQYQQKFVTWLLGENHSKTLWEDKHLSELKIMLTHKGWNDDLQERTRYMAIKSQQGDNEYRDRYILLSPHEVWNGKADERTTPPVPTQEARRDTSRPAQSSNSNTQSRGNSGNSFTGKPLGSNVVTEQPSITSPQYPSHIRNLLNDIQDLTDKTVRQGKFGLILNRIKNEKDKHHQKVLALALDKRAKELDLSNISKFPKLQKALSELQELLNSLNQDSSGGN